MGRGTHTGYGFVEIWRPTCAAAGSSTTCASCASPSAASPSACWDTWIETRDEELGKLRESGASASAASAAAYLIVHLEFLATILLLFRFLLSRFLLFRF